MKKPSERINEIYNELAKHTLYPKNNEIKAILQYLDEEKEKDESLCTPHNFVDYKFDGAWGASVPIPKKICVKCSMTL